MSTLLLVAYLARAGVGSRRRCDEMVRDGHVAVNGEPVTFPRQPVNDGDVVTVDGEEVLLRPLRYVLVNKPRGVASTRRDPHAERVLVDLVPDGRVLFPVGRLDVETTGLIILTNDGELTAQLLHPRYHVDKEYIVTVRGTVTPPEVAQLRRGIELEDGLTSPAEVDVVEAREFRPSTPTTTLRVVIHEGRKRQVRRMMESVGHVVVALHRHSFGGLTDAGLAVGQARPLSEVEVEQLRHAGNRG